MTDYPITPTIGILGGASNVATGKMYARINALSLPLLNKTSEGLHIVQTLIAGMDFGVIEHAVRENNWSGLANYMEVHLDRLSSADLIVCVSNTLHKDLGPIMAKRPQKFLHIAQPTADAIKDAGLSCVALFGTKPVMSADYMIQSYEEAGIKISVPTDQEQDDIDRIIFDELCKFEIKETSRQRYVEIAQRLERDEGAQGIILGCTEIETLLRPQDVPELPMFDTMELLCQGAVNAVLKKA